jgi:hypothetical protein
MTGKRLTNDDLRRYADEKHLCRGCFGWGFPIMAFNGREAYNVSVKCVDCGGTGKRPSYADETEPKP